MKLSLSHQWGAEISKFVYKGDVSVEVTVDTRKTAEAKTTLPEVVYDPSKKTENEQWSAIDEKYGKSAYESIISAYVDKLMPVAPGDYKDALLRDSTRRYAQFYDHIKRDFMVRGKELREKFDYAVDHVKAQTSSELSVLKSAVEGSKALVGFKETMPGPESKNAVREHFEKYLDALNGRYFNPDVNEGVEIPGSGIPIIDPLLHPDTKVLDTRAYPKESQSLAIFGIFTGSDVFKGGQYKSKASDFQNNMKNWVGARLDWMLNKKETKKEDLETFKAEITSRYEMYAQLDNNSSIISGADLKALEVAANPPPDAMARILDESDEKSVRRMELVQLMNPDAWEDVVEMVGDSVIQAARNSGAEKEFVAEMKKYQPVEDFGDAADAFEDRLKEISKVGVREALEFIRQFNLGVHGEVLQYEKSVKPPALAMQVGKQMDYLLSGILTPQKDTDRMLVRFMNSNLSGRNDILANDGTREVLFRAIRQATEQYPEIYDKQFGNIPDDVKKLRRSTRIEQPSFHDRAAQMQALIILGNQAKVIVSQLERAPEHAGKKYVEQINNTRVPEDPSVVMTGLRFKAPGGGNVRFRSALERGGFNTRDLALKGAKVIGILTIVSNVAQSWSETHGDFADRVFETVEKAATNQGVLIGAAATVGAHMAERDPRFLKYPWLSQHERAGVMTSFKLDNLAARVGLEEMNRFLYNNAEWRALSDTAMDPAQIKEMIQEAAKRTASGSHPTITVADLRKVIKDESIITTLTTGGKSARMRYLFYSKFFAAAVKPDVNHVKELCTGGSHISPSPVQTS